MSETTRPTEGLARLFLRFLRFGALAWGGPAAQIAMIRHELVDTEHWLDKDRFNRVLAVYQALPGPEAHELCVYMGWLVRGRLGGLVAGLGFMLPGLVLMLLAGWAYAAYGLRDPLTAAAFLSVQSAVAALIVRAVHRIGAHAVHGPWLGAIAAAATLAQLAGVGFAWTLLLSAATYALSGTRARWAALLPLAGMVALAGWAALPVAGTEAAAPDVVAAAGTASTAELAGSGLRAGLLTFGGAYTVIPFLLEDAVRTGGWLTESQFIDGVAIGGVLPAPLVIIATFVGLLAGGPAGALAMTAGVFLPAFAFTLVGHGLVERLVNWKPAHRVLDGVTAGTVGIIAATAIALLPRACGTPEGAAVFAFGVVALYLTKARWAVPAVVLGAAAAGAGLHAAGLAFV